MPEQELRLSVLDQAPIAQGQTGAQALRNSVDLARLAERRGYHRYWVAEHHGTPMLACASPEALIGAIAARTSRMRVGSGGGLLPPHNPPHQGGGGHKLPGGVPRRLHPGAGPPPGA